MFVLIEINLAVVNVASRIVLLVVFKLILLDHSYCHEHHGGKSPWYLFCSAPYSAVFEIKEIPV